jgi:hypothetical protein
MSTQTPEELNALEGRLAATLKPVPPQQAFVHNVRRRITVAAPVIAIRPTPGVNTWLVTVAMVLSVFVLAALVGRVLLLLLGRTR